VTACAHVRRSSAASSGCTDHVVCSAVAHGEGAIAVDDLLGARGPSESEVSSEDVFMSSSLS